jgi:proteasome alpha subunit
MDLQKAVTVAMSILKQTMEEKMTSESVEVFVVDSESKQFKKLSDQELQTFMQNLIDMS